MELDEIKHIAAILGGGIWLTKVDDDTYTAWEGRYLVYKLPEPSAWGIDENLGGEWVKRKPVGLGIFYSLEECRDFLTRFVELRHGR